MKKAIAVGLVTTLAVSGLVMSALAQQPAPAQNNPGRSLFYPVQDGQTSPMALPTVLCSAKLNLRAKLISSPGNLRRPRGKVNARR